MKDDLSRWEKNNEAYLSSALTWLRLGLTQLAGEESLASRIQVPDPGGESPGALSQESLFSNDGRGVMQARTDMDAAAQGDPPPAAIILGSKFGLSHFELDILLLCAGLEFDTRMADLCARAQGNPNRPYPTFALAMTLFDEPAWEALSPERPLRRWHLIEINQPGAQPLTTSALRADERIVSYLKGLNYLDDRLEPFLWPFKHADRSVNLPPSQQSLADRIVHRLNRGAGDQSLPLVQLVGPDGLSKQLVANYVAEQLGLHLYRLPADMLPTGTAELERFIRLWERETILLPVALYVDAKNASRGEEKNDHPPALPRLLSRSKCLCFLDTRETRTDLERATFSLDITKPTPSEQQEGWRRALHPTADDSPSRLASQFDLNLTTIGEIASGVQERGSRDAFSLQERMWQACLQRTRPQLDQLAQRLDPKATWDDIVLPEEQMGLLRQISGQVGQRAQVYDEWGFRKKMNRGLGINALFAGESGTGKTMAAEVIANALQLNLYRIDLSAVVSKYIGETEKNLRKLFDAAENGGAILFFDEADALFGKRSEVRDSHDRYANIETSYLLQRMESYRGLSILATNMKSALDQAFMRRLRFIVDFPFPGPRERARMWRTAFPVDTPVENLDYGRLSQFRLTGGNIHSITLNAAFLAAEAGQAVTMPMVLSAARSEFRKLERPINEADFRWQAAPDGH